MVGESKLIPGQLGLQVKVVGPSLGVEAADVRVWLQIGTQYALLGAADIESLVNGLRQATLMCQKGAQIIEEGRGQGTKEEVLENYVAQELQCK